MVPRRAALFVKGGYRMNESVTRMLEELTWVPLMLLLVTYFWLFSRLFIQLGQQLQPSTLDVKTLVSFFSTKLLIHPANHAYKRLMGIHVKKHSMKFRHI